MGPTTVDRLKEVNNRLDIFHFPRRTPFSEEFEDYAACRPKLDPFRRDFDYSGTHPYKGSP